MRVYTFRQNLNAPLPRGKLDGVGNEVPNHLLYTTGVSGDSVRPRIERCLQLDSLGFGRRAHRVGHRFYYQWKIHRSNFNGKLPCNNARDVKDVLDYPALRLEVTLNDLHRPLSAPRIQIPSTQELYPAGHRV